MTISNPINGYTHTVSAYVTEHFIRYTNHTVPNAYATAVPTTQPNIVRKIFLCESSITAPPISAMNMKPIRYPPVGPRSFPNPPANPENTGSPTAPSSRYIP